MNDVAYEIQGGYDYKYLNERDKASVDAVNSVAEKILTTEVINDFIESKSFSGRTLQSIYKEALTDFVNFLREQVEYRKVDFVIEKIDGYSDDEFAKLSGGVEKPKPNIEML